MSKIYIEEFAREIDKIRLLILDRPPPSWTDPSVYKYVYTDEENAELLVQFGGSIFKTAAQCCRSMALDAARRSFNFDLLQQDLRIDRSLLPGHLMKMAAQYESMANSEIATYLDTVEDGDDEWLKTVMNFSPYDMESSE